MRTVKLKAERRIDMSNLQSFEARVKEKLKEQIADLIPSEKLDEIVRATVAEYTRVDLPALIKAELAARYKEEIRAEFAKPEWQPTWVNGQQSAGTAVQQLLIEAAPLVLASMMAGVSQSVVYNFQQSLQNVRQY